MQRASLIQSIQPIRNALVPVDSPWAPRIIEQLDEFSTQESVDPVAHIERALGGTEHLLWKRPGIVPIASSAFLDVAADYFAEALDPEMLSWSLRHDLSGRLFRVSYNIQRPDVGFDVPSANKLGSKLFHAAFHMGSIYGICKALEDWAFREERELAKDNFVFENHWDLDVKTNTSSSQFYLWKVAETYLCRRSERPAFIKNIHERLLELGLTILSGYNSLIGLVEDIRAREFNETDGNPLALITKAQYDHNNALRNVHSTYLREAGFRVLRFQVQNNIGFRQAVESCSEAIQLHIIDAHGNPNLVCWSQDNDNRYDMHHNDVYETFKGLKDCFAEGAFLMIFGCKTADKTEDDLPGLAQNISAQIPQVFVMGFSSIIHASDLHEWLSLDDDGKVQFRFGFGNNGLEVPPLCFKDGKLIDLPENVKVRLLPKGLKKFAFYI